VGLAEHLRKLGRIGHRVVIVAPLWGRRWAPAVSPRTVAHSALHGKGATWQRCDGSQAMSHRREQKGLDRPLARDTSASAGEARPAADEGVATAGGHRRP